MGVRDMVYGGGYLYIIRYHIQNEIQYPVIPYYIIIVYVYPYYHTVSSDHCIPYLIKDMSGSGAALPVCCCHPAGCRAALPETEKVYREVLSRLSHCHRAAVLLLFPGAGRAHWCGNNSVTRPDCCRGPELPISRRSREYHEIVTRYPVPDLSTARGQDALLLLLCCRGPAVDRLSSFPQKRDMAVICV